MNEPIGVKAECSDGMTLAGLRWQTTSAESTTTPMKSVPVRRILALHGWLDNCHSYCKLASHLTTATLPTHGSTDTDFVAIDLPGHGLSSHKSVDGPPMVMADLAFYVAELVKHLDWDHHDKTFALIGHSMGAGVSILYAAAFPEQVSKLILLEGAGPQPKNPMDAAKNLRSHIDRRRKGNESKEHERKSIYPSIDEAIMTRQMTAQAFPGKQYISSEAARELVERVTRPTHDGKIQFLHDPRLRWPSIQFFTPDQVQSLYHDLQSDCCILLAKDGWPFDEDTLKQTKEAIKPSTFEILPGSHHFHMDPDTTEAVAEAVTAFLNQ